MKKILSIALLGSIASVSSAQYNSKNLTIRENVVTQFTYKNLRLYPIYANAAFMDAHKDIGKYSPLQKALQDKKVSITEAVSATPNQNQSINSHQNIQQQSNSGGGETVNKLYIENVSNDTVMIMAGEVVKGGKQDRVIAQDIILTPKSGKMDISVFCVEQGRWTYSDASMKANKSFYGYSNVSSTNVRKSAMVEKSQQGVWDQVEVVTSKNSAGTKSGTYTALDTSKTYQRDLNSYLDYFKAVMKSQNNVIGVVACTDDKVIGCDMFATPSMFNDQFPNLLNSYSTEAMTNGAVAKADYKKVQAYLDKILSDESKQDEEVKKNGAVLKHRGKKLHMATF